MFDTFHSLSASDFQQVNSNLYFCVQCWMSFFTGPCLTPKADNILLRTVGKFSKRFTVVVNMTFDFLQTGNESSVDRLMKQITSFMSEIPDEFKVVVVQAIR